MLQAIFTIIFILNNLIVLFFFFVFVVWPRQRVYGVTWALVRVGYAYSNCGQIIWDTQTTQVSGHEMSISDIGGWDLSIHHRYNFHEGWHCKIY